MFAEDLAAFFDDVDGFSVGVALNGDPVQAMLDAPGVDAFDGSVSTTEPSALMTADTGVDVDDQIVVDAADLPAQMAHLAGTYTVRSVVPEPPDGALVRAFIVKS